MAYFCIFVSSNQITYMYNCFEYLSKILINSYILLAFIAVNIGIDLKTDYSILFFQLKRKKIFIIQVVKETKITSRRQYFITSNINAYQYRKSMLVMKSSVYSSNTLLKILIKMLFKVNSQMGKKYLLRKTMELCWILFISIHLSTLIHYHNLASGQRCDTINFNG